MKLFHHLHYGLSAILVFVGAKMLLADFYKIPVGVALGAVAGILIISVIASLAFPRKEVDASGGSKPPRERRPTVWSGELPHCPCRRRAGKNTCNPRGFSLEINYEETWRHPCDLNLRLRV